MTGEDIIWNVGLATTCAGSLLGIGLCLCGIASCGARLAVMSLRRMGNVAANLRLVARWVEAGRPVLRWSEEKEDFIWVKSAEAGGG